MTLNFSKTFASRSPFSPFPSDIKKSLLANVLMTCVTLTFALATAVLPTLAAQAENTPSATTKDGGLASLKKSGVLRVGLDPGFVPFEMKTSKGELIGFDIDMISAFAKDIGVTPKFVDTKWDGIIPALVTKKFDLIVSGMTVTAERSKAVLFSDVYYNAGLIALVNSSQKDKIKSLTDLDSPAVTIAVKVGTTGDSFVKDHLKKAKIQKLDSESDCANAVALGKVQAFIYDKPYVQIFEKTSAGKVYVLNELMSAEGFGVAGRKKDTELIGAFNAFLGKWKSSGEYDKHIKKHFVDLEWQKSVPATN